MATKCRTCAVEFWAGPVDGYLLELNYPAPPYMAAMMTRPSRLPRWLQRWLLWRRPRTRVAIYRLYCRDGRWKYRYAGSFAGFPFKLPCIQVDLVPVDLSGSRSL